MSRLIEATTLDEFKWKFRDGCLWAATNHSPSGGVEGVRMDVLHRLGINNLAMGPGVEFCNTVDLAAMPVGTLLSQYKADQETYRVCVITGMGRVERLLGARDLDMRRPAIVVEMPDHERPAWLDVEPRPDEQEQIEAWKQEALRVGVRAKQKWGWCGDFELVMRRMGFAL